MMPIFCGRQGHGRTSDTDETQGAIAAACLTFLRTDGAIGNLRFDMAGIAVAPNAYRHGQARKIAERRLSFRIRPDLLRTGIKAAWVVRTHRTPGTATPPPPAEILFVRPGFQIARPDDRQYLVHELTHAHLHDLAIGIHARWHNEAVAYVAQAIWSLSQPPLGLSGGFDSLTTVAAAHIAAKVLDGETTVSLADTLTLMHAIKHDPLYRWLSPTVQSDPMSTHRQTAIGDRSRRLSELLL